MALKGMPLPFRSLNFFEQKIKCKQKNTGNQSRIHTFFVVVYISPLQNDQ